MTRRRWIADKVTGERAWLLGANAQHLAKVLRARVGQQFDISCDGSVRPGRVSAISEESVEFELGDPLPPSGGASNVSLLLAIFKFDRMEWAIEKATELGVMSIFPVVAKKTDAHLAAASAKRVERWRRLAHEASQQSRRDTEPLIHLPSALKECLAQTTLPRIRILLDEGEQDRKLQAALSSPNASDPKVIAIGPEGGWTTQEITLFHDQGWTSASLGKTILRSETAAIAALAIASVLNPD